MFPNRERDEEERLRRIGSAFPGDPRGIEQKYGKTAELTELGEKLLGLALWDPPEAV